MKKKSFNSKEKSDPIIKKNTEETEESKITMRKTSFRNYWLEVYLESEATWQPIDLMENNFSCKPEHFEQRFDKQILYVCGFDNDNKVKEVTKRYASKWLTITRLLRVDFIEKKLWWERTLMFHQTLDVDLDIEEERNLKSILFIYLNWFFF